MPSKNSPAFRLTKPSILTQKLNPFEKPPEDVQALFRRFRTQKSLDDPELVDFRIYQDDSVQNSSLKAVAILPSARLTAACKALAADVDIDTTAIKGCQVYEDTRCPGLYCIPGVLDVATQAGLLDRLLHRDLTNPIHKTNVHAHHNITYPQKNSSFFSALKSVTHEPKDSKINKIMSVESFLHNKLRWMTLGGQYNWTNKEYPNEVPPPFPEDLGRFLRTLMPEIEPEAAICNLYSPGDRLSVHRDVSELCEVPLLSVSIGCDAIFVCQANTTGTNSSERPAPIAVRIRSGDMMIMSGPSRFAWHGVPLVIKNTCPIEIENWPAAKHAESSSKTEAQTGQDSEYEQWRGWMRGKRINLNVRQMVDIHGSQAPESETIGSWEKPNEQVTPD